MSLNLKPNFLSSWHHFLCPILHVYGHSQAKTHSIAFAPSFLLLHWACAQDMSVLRGLSHSPLFILTATKLCQSNQPSSVQATFPSLSHSVLITTLRIALVYLVYTGLLFENWISFQTCSRLTSKNRCPEWNPNKALDSKRELKRSGQNSLCLLCHLLGGWVLILLSLILFIQKIYKIFLLNVVLLNDMCFVLSCSEVFNSLPPHGQKPARLLCRGFPSKNIEVGCHLPLQEIFPTQESNSCLLHLLHCMWILYPWAARDAPVKWYTAC